MKKTFIVAMFIFWGFVVAVVSAGYIVKQNRIAQEAIQKTYTDNLQQIIDATEKGKGTVSLPTTTVVTPTTTSKPVGTLSKPSPVSMPRPVSMPPTSMMGLTMNTVALHSTQSDCWIVINGNVYSVASYIPMHPGGSQRIVNVCGGDATSVFTGTGGRGSHRHSSYAQSLLGSYLVGPLQ